MKRSPTPKYPFDMQRATDLLRYMRFELHEQGLISNEEYAQLAAHQGAVPRLEGYDATKVQFKLNTTVNQRLQDQLNKYVTDHYAASCMLLEAKILDFMRRTGLDRDQVGLYVYKLGTYPQWKGAQTGGRRPRLPK